MLTVESFLNYKLFKSLNIYAYSLDECKRSYIQWIIDSFDISISDNANIRYFVSQQLTNYHKDDYDIFKENFTKFLALKSRKCSADRIMLTHGNKNGPNRILEWKESVKTLPENKEKAKRNVSKGLNRYYNNTTPDERKARWKKNQEYWIKHGYDKATSKILASREEEKRKINQLRSITTEDYKERLQSFNHLKVAYWLNKGFSEEEAIRKISERQSTFSLEKCIDKYGPIDGIQLWNERQKRWQKTLNLKTYEEKAEINRKKYNKRRGLASISSLAFFLPLIEILKSDNILNEINYYIGYGDRNEWFLNRGKGNLYFYDFCIRDIKIIIDFHGLAWHYNFDTCCITNNVLNLDEEETKLNDLNRKRVAEELGFIYIIVWERNDKNYKQDLEYVLDRIRSAYKGYKKIDS